MATLWKALTWFDGKNCIDIGRFAVLVLNQPITLPKRYMLDIWNGASFRATADGGTDRWYEFVASISSRDHTLKKIHPDLISGDFDSVKPETIKRCLENNVKMLKTPDQDKTDFTKALEEIWKETGGEIDSVITIVDNSGRLDHIMSNLNTLYEPHQHRLYLLGSNSLTWLLAPGLHHIEVPQSLVVSKAHCGLIPLGEPCTVTTTGLKWNLNKDKMQFGGLISTCNLFSENNSGLVTVETDNPVLWTATVVRKDHSR
ncbi:thiamin pyrophosphokinase 1-like [Macrosteles quadrilineatus]|uniref:thiamin pyrophosphokinase 1-like n=1 Tax=Macrosteles quadrilineatus TaxID=74068 RepID=UPI0023E1E817|nr:thiamin pyrophosphokinase 1-like [Macrosteles quadrilineatus]